MAACMRQRVKQHPARAARFHGATARRRPRAATSNTCNNQLRDEPTSRSITPSCCSQQAPSSDYDDAAASAPLVVRVPDAHLPARGGGAVVQAQRQGPAERVDRARQDVQVQQPRRQAHGLHDDALSQVADLLAHGDTSVQHGHLQSRAHLPPLLLGALVQGGDETEGDGKCPRLGHDGDSQASDGQDPGVPHHERRQETNDGP
mmetsp:Transcript_17472/g.54985  ORF Transcript_17472/g.54985 Transcript_17472/m.54985 type:complete len:204 (-) Transcript_17472:1108-1719(-)